MDYVESRSAEQLRNDVLAFLAEYDALCEKYKLALDVYWDETMVVDTLYTHTNKEIAKSPLHRLGGDDWNPCLEISQDNRSLGVI